MEHRQHNQLVQRISRLVKQNKELGQELRSLREAYEQLLLKYEEYESLVEHYKKTSEIPEFAFPEKPATLKFNMVTVLFCDFHGFKDFLPEENNERLIDHLDNIHVKFDEIVVNYPIEKIKTIGDSYMCAGGIPEKNITNPVEVVLAALQMLHYVKSFNGEFKKSWETRIAVHTGPVVATTSGKLKISYDIKGDTVNIASRMESSGKNGMLLISVMTRELVREFFDCEYYGRLPVKYKGNLDLYVVKGIIPELSENGEGIMPNLQFKTRFALIQFHDLQEEILDLLEKELPENLYYHNLKHTVDVVTEVELIGWAEGVTDDEILLLKTAALFHDSGHTVSYHDHELHGAELARKVLPRYHYSSEQIDKVCDIIMATQMPPKPRNLLEQIICDADLDYLGRTDFIPVSNTLFEELKIRNMIGTLNEWNKLQIKFISKHQYFTGTARKLREVNKQSQIERLGKLIED